MNCAGEKTKLRITWNITKKCLFHCSFCATETNRTELSIAGKEKVLANICQSKHFSIEEIDFAGGDPLLDDASRNMVLSAQRLLGKSHVTVTTTWRGISTLPTEQLSDLLYSCELSMDIPLCSQKRNEPTYSSGNLTAIQLYFDYYHQLTINLPIIDTDISEKDILELCEKLNQFADKGIRLVIIRLMPVGRSRSSFLPDHYDPEKVVRLLRKRIDPRIPIHLHCVLRGIIDRDSNCCSMVTRKIGIDCAGNVFACAWAGDCFCENPPQCNPFYLGSLLEQSLDTIMLSEGASKLITVASKAGFDCPLLANLKERSD